MDTIPDLKRGGFYFWRRNFAIFRLSMNGCPPPVVWCTDLIRRRASDTKAFNKRRSEGKTKGRSSRAVFSPILQECPKKTDIPVCGCLLHLVHCNLVVCILGSGAFPSASSCLYIHIWPVSLLALSVSLSPPFSHAVVYTDAVCEWIGNAPSHTYFGAAENGRVEKRLFVMN